ncbi:hypothetical protein BDB01DRAFT_834751 [Pilobolus umbonatus]|nr:hypothetical protein BDB01DRAFT_834751 [Pilobolus umbonatus]
MKRHNSISKHKGAIEEAYQKLSNTRDSSYNSLDQQSVFKDEHNLYTFIHSFNGYLDQIWSDAQTILQCAQVWSLHKPDLNSVNAIDTMEIVGLQMMEQSLIKRQEFFSIINQINSISSSNQSIDVIHGVYAPNNKLEKMLDIPQLPTLDEKKPMLAKNSPSTPMIGNRNKFIYPTEIQTHQPELHTPTMTSHKCQNESSCSASSINAHIKNSLALGKYKTLEKQYYNHSSGNAVYLINNDNQPQRYIDNHNHDYQSLHYKNMEYHPFANNLTFELEQLADLNYYHYAPHSYSTSGTGSTSNKYPSTEQDSSSTCTYLPKSTTVYSTPSSLSNGSIVNGNFFNGKALFNNIKASKVVIHFKSKMQKKKDVSNFNLKSISKNQIKLCHLFTSKC